MTSRTPTVPLETVVDPARPITYGIVLPGSDVPDGVPYVRVVDMQDGTVRLEQLRRTTAEIAHSYRRSALAEGDLLVSIRGHVGRTAFVPKGGDGANLTQDTARVAIIPSVDRRYIRWFIESPVARRWMAQHTKGVAVTGINLGDLRKLPVPLPRSDEQRRIADILDKADAIRRKRKEAIALTEELLRSAFSEMFGDIPAKRSPWPFTPLRAFLSAASGKSSKSVLSPVETRIPIYGGNGINGWATKALYDEPVVVVGRVGQQCGITRMTDGPAWVTDNAIVVRIERPDVLHPVYLATALQRSPLRAGVMRLDLPFINQGTILDYPLPLPPLSEQRRFAELRERVFKSQASLALSLREADRLFGALVQGAFTGALEAA